MKTNHSNSRSNNSRLAAGNCLGPFGIRNISPTHLTTGFPELDNLLPGSGWPVAALTELFQAQPGVGELRLLLPALARLSRLGRWIALIAPPLVPYAPALEAAGLDPARLLLVHPRSQPDGLHALEQGLRSGTCGAVLAWPKHIDQQALQRLQAAATTGHSWGILFRHPACQEQPSPAALRLQLRACNGNAEIHIKQCNGGLADAELMLDLSRRASLPSAPVAPVVSTPAWQRPQQHPRKFYRRAPTPRPPESLQLDLPLI